MPIRFDDRVRDSSTTTGTGNIACTGVAPLNYRPFSILSTSDTFPYAVVHRTAAEWEIGLGTIVSSNVFSRSPTASTNANALVNFSAGTKDVVLCPISDKTTMRQWLSGGTTLPTPSIQQGVQSTPANTTETTLFSYTLPANSITAVGKGLKIKSAGYWGTSLNGGTIRLYFGSEVMSIINQVCNGERWAAQMEVVCSQLGPTKEFVTGVSWANFVMPPFGSNPTVDLTSSVVIKVTGQNDTNNAGDCNAYQLIVEPLVSDLVAAII